MSAFDDMTLGEVELVTKEVLNGKPFSDDAADPLMVAGGVMWITQRRDDPSLTWDVFKNRTTMSAIKAFSIDLEATTITDPTNARSALPS